MLDCFYMSIISWINFVYFYINLMVLDRFLILDYIFFNDFVKFLLMYFGYDVVLFGSDNYYLKNLFEVYNRQDLLKVNIMY